MGPRFSFLCITATLEIVACAPPSMPPLVNPREAPSAVAALAGCWSFTGRSTHESHMPQGLVVRLHQAPADTFKLNTLRLTVDTPLSARDRFGRWGLIAHSEQIFASWGDGLTGLSLKLTVEGDTLRGRAARTTDFPTFPSGFSVIGARVPCPSSL